MARLISLALFGILVVSVSAAWYETTPRIHNDTVPPTPVPVQHILKGSTLNLTVSDQIPNFKENKTFWWKNRLWSPTRGDGFTWAGNCSWHPTMAKRLLRCNNTLLVKNTDWNDAGIWRMKYKMNKTSSLYFWFNISVYETQPVLSIISASRSQLRLQCFNLRNPSGQLSLETMPMDGAPAPNKQTSNSSYTTLTIDGSDYFAAWVRCCSIDFGHQTCSPWRHLVHQFYIHPSHPAKHPKCNYGGRSYSDTISLLRYSNDVTLPEGNCSATEFPYKQRSFELCYNINSSILAPDFSSLVMYRPMYGLKLAFKHGPFTFSPPLLNDTGLYYISDWTQVSITVLPELQTAIEFIGTTNTGLLLKCAHNGKESTSIEWIIEGLYGGYERHTQGPFHLMIWPDCWNSWTRHPHWEANFRVRCRVTDGPWTATSPWFMMFMMRNFYYSK